MRFADSLRINTNQSWWKFYIPYDDLKKRIERLAHLHNAKFVQSTLGTVTASSRHHDSSATRTTRGIQGGRYGGRGGGGGDSSEEEVDVENPSPSSSSQGGTSVEGPRLPRRASTAVLRALEDEDIDNHTSAASANRERSTEAVPPLSLPPVTSASDAAIQFDIEEHRFFEKLDDSARIANDFYTRMCEALREAADSLYERGALVLMTRASRLGANFENAGEGTALLHRVDGLLDGSHDVDDLQLRADLKGHFREAQETRNFANLNLTGFAKILKKHDKVTNGNSKETYMNRLYRSTSLKSTAGLDQLIESAVQQYAKLFADGSISKAQSDLAVGLRDLVFWERGTNWADGVYDKHRSSAMRTVRAGNDYMAQHIGPGKCEARPFVVLAAVLMCSCIAWNDSILRSILGSEATILYRPETIAAANRAFALLVFAIILWAGKGIPLYATSFLVFAGASVARVFVDSDGVPLSAHDASEHVVRSIGSSTVILILSVYAFASALKKYEIDRQIATAALSLLKPNGAYLLALLMTLSIFISMFVSNVASPVLLTSVMKPTFDSLDNMGSFNKRYIKGFLFGIMVACNIGGFISPIASPQSAVAIGLLTGTYKLGFLKWVAVAFPLAVVMCSVAFVGLNFWYGLSEVKLPPMQKTNLKYTWGHYGTILTLTMTIILWLIPWFSAVFGSTGIIAALPIAIIFGAGILKKSDFNSLAWDVVMLVAGGSVVGAAVESSKLLNMLSERLMHNLGGYLFRSYAVLCIVIACISVVVSHTVSAIILLPLFLQIGEQFGRPQMFVIGGAIAASCAMATNVASFPNLTTSELQDDKDEHYVSNAEITWVGAPMTIISVFILITVGFVSSYFSLT